MEEPGGGTANGDLGDSGPEKRSSSGASSSADRYDDPLGDDWQAEQQPQDQPWFFASDASSSSSIAVAGLLDELSAIQATYTRLTAALSQSERENLLLVNSLASVSAERHRLQEVIVHERSAAAARVRECESDLHRVEREKEMLDGAVTAGLELRVADLEKQNAELRRKLLTAMRSSSSPTSRAVSTSVERGTNTAQTGCHAESVGALRGGSPPEVATLSCASSPILGNRPTAAPALLSEGAASASFTNSNISNPGADEDVAAARASSSSWSPQRADSTANDGAVAPSSTTPPHHHQIAAREYLHAATVEKLWAMVQCRGRELERVARLLASAESRNVELAKLLFQVCQSVAPPTVQSGTSAAQVSAAAAAFVSRGAVDAPIDAADGSVGAVAKSATIGGRGGACGAVIVSAATTPTSQQHGRTPQRQRRATTIVISSSASPADGSRGLAPQTRAQLTSPTKVPPQRVVPGGFSFESLSSVAPSSQLGDAAHMQHDRLRMDGGISPSSTPAAMNIKPHTAADRRHSLVGHRVVEKPRFRF